MTLAVEVTVFERGSYTSYSACGIPYFIAGRVHRPDDLIARSVDEFRQAGIAVRTLSEVIDLDVAARTLIYRDHIARADRREGFGQFVYAPGAVVVAPPVPGAELVEPVRTVTAAERLLAGLEHARGRQAVVIGAGYLGLEMAEAFVMRGLEVTLVDRDDQVMPPLDPEAAAELSVVTATIKDSTRAHYYPGAGPIWVKLVAGAEDGRLLGGQIVGVEGVAKRIDVLAVALWSEKRVDEIELVDLGYAPPFSGVYDPLLRERHAP